MSAFQDHMKRELGGGKLKGKSKKERADAFKMAVFRWNKKSGKRTEKTKPRVGLVFKEAGRARPSRPSSGFKEIGKKRRLSRKARAAAIRNLRRARNVQRKSGARSGVRRRGLDRKSQRGRGMGFGRVPAAATRGSLTLATPGYFPAANPSSPRAHGDVHNTPSPSLNGDTYNGQPILPRVADGVRIDIRGHEAALIRR